MTHSVWFILPGKVRLGRRSQFIGAKDDNIAVEPHDDLNVLQRSVHLIFDRCDHPCVFEFGVIDQSGANKIFSILFAVVRDLFFVFLRRTTFGRESSGLLS
jgi:hypothetical protein